MAGRASTTRSGSTARPRMDEWTWQGLIPHTAAACRGLYTGVVYSAAGSRLATIAQETLFRKPRQP